jgi:hypothetical protein
MAARETEIMDLKIGRVTLTTVRENPIFRCVGHGVAQNAPERLMTPAAMIAAGYFVNPPVGGFFYRQHGNWDVFTATNL